MEYIKIEQFLNQPKDIQDELLKWWNPSIGDLYTYAIKDEQDYSELSCVTSTNVAKQTKINKGERIPLFTEGQLRALIEKKADCKVMVEYTSCGNIVIKVCTEDEVTGSLRCNRKLTFSSNKFNLLSAYWELAIKIIK